MGDEAARVIRRLLLLEDHNVGRDRCGTRPADDKQPRRLAKPVGPGIAEPAPERPVRRRLARTVGKQPLIDDGDLPLVGRGPWIAVGIEHVAGVTGVGTPAGAPGDPDPKLSRSSRRVSKHGLAGLRSPPVILLAQVR